MSDLLPSNSTPLMRALAALSDRVDGIDPASIAHLWDAARCPESVLPWLAWSLSVDTWDDTWPVARKREAITSSPGYHRLKGTVSSLDIVSRLFGCRTSIVEWWQKAPQGRRGTATIRAFVSERTVEGAPLITAELINKVRAAVYISKPKSRAVTFEMGVAVSGKLHIASAAQAMQVGVFDGKALTPRRGRASVALAAAGQALQLHVGAAVVSTPRTGRASLKFAMAAQAMQVGHFQAFARHRSRV